MMELRTEPVAGMLEQLLLDLHQQHQHHQHLQHQQQQQQQPLTSSSSASSSTSSRESLRSLISSSSSSSSSSSVFELAHQLTLPSPALEVCTQTQVGMVVHAGHMAYLEQSVFGTEQEQAVWHQNEAQWVAQFQQYQVQQPSQPTSSSASSTSSFGTLGHSSSSSSSSMISPSLPSRPWITPVLELPPGPYVPFPRHLLTNLALMGIPQLQSVRAVVALDVENICSFFAKTAAAKRTCELIVQLAQTPSPSSPRSSSPSSSSTKGAKGGVGRSGGGDYATWESGATASAKYPQPSLNQPAVLLQINVQVRER
jgi:hypothetical protein